MAVPEYFEIRSHGWVGITASVHAGAIFNAAPLENPVFPGKYWHFFRPEDSLAPVCGGGKRCPASFPPQKRVCVRTLKSRFEEKAPGVWTLMYQGPHLDFGCGPFIV